VTFSSQLILIIPNSNGIPAEAAAAIVSGIVIVAIAALAAVVLLVLRQCLRQNKIDRRHDQLTTQTRSWIF
jgi:hypothetical protein